MKLFFLLILLSCGACFSSQVDEFNSLQLIVGDTLKVSVLNNFLEEELAIPIVTVNRKDKIILPHLGEFDILDKSIGQFKIELNQRVSTRLYLKNPNLLIDINKNILISASIKNRFLGEYKLRYHSSIGELLKAINVITVLDMDPQTVILTRNNSETIINFQENPQLTKIILKHNDYIKINTRLENTNNFYYLVGNFSKIGRYYMETKITLMDLLATQNLTQPRYTRKFYIFRKHQDDTMIIEADARQLMKMGDLTQNISIQGGDVILASVERKMHLLQKYKDILNQYTDIDDFIKNAQNIRLFK
jgi:protein involved in polysaccharide export with SLBB domain